MNRQEAVILAGFSENQRRAALERDKDIILRAGAGSGKTKTLVGRYLTLLDEHRDWLPEDITAVTFTRKAAQEMQNRIREQMLALAEANADDPEEQLHWLKLLNEMDNACIGTIHSLCGRILRAYPAEAGLDPRFEVIEEMDTKLLRMQAAAEMLEQIAGKEEFAPLLSFYKEDTLAEIFEDLLGRNPDPDVPLVSSQEVLQFCLNDFLESFCTVGFIAQYQDSLSSAASRLKDDLRNRFRMLSDLFEKLSRGAQAFSSSYAVLQAVKDIFNGWDFRPGPGIDAKKKAKEFRDQMREGFPCLKDEKHSIDWYRRQYEAYDAAALCLWRLWPELQSLYQEMLRNRDVQDFDSLENNALKLLREHSEVAEDCGKSIKALLVDEYQDTNDRQAELFSLLNPRHDRLFVVGDKKQSIYGFRGSEVSLFGKRAEEIARSGGADLMLDETFRTDPALLKPMSVLLDAAMADENLENEEYYASYEPMQAGKKAAGDGNSPEPRVEVLIGEWNDSEKKEKSQNPGAILLAQRLLEMKQEGTLKDWGEAAILFRKSHDFAAYENVLEAYQIPYVTVSGQGFYDRPEIRDVINLLKCAENPRDNTLLSGALLSPVLGFTPSMLVLLHRHSHQQEPKIPFWQVLTAETFVYTDAEEHEKLLRAREILTALNAMAGKVPLDQVLERLYALTGFRTMLAGEPSSRGWQNLDKLLMDARNSGMVLVSDFLRWLKDTNTAGTREGEAPQESEGAVRLMTIHKAKGLEFPITVIANPEKALDKRHKQVTAVSEQWGLSFLSSPESLQHQDAQIEVWAREKAEWLRLLYVAATRAERHLIFCGEQPAMSETSDNWLNRVLRVVPDVWDEYVGPMKDCGKDCPVHYRLRGVDPVEKVPVSATVAEPPVPDVRLLPPVAAAPVLKIDTQNPFALAVGNLVHKALECWCFPGDPRLKAIWERLLLQSDRLNAEEREQAQARAELLLTRFRASEVYQRVENAEMRRHEIPFSTVLGKYSLNGVIDLLLKEPGGYVILDFKSDALNTPDDLRAAIDKYTKQLIRYRNALRSTLRAEAECGLCFLDDSGKVTYWPVGPGLLDREEMPEAPDVPDDFGEMDLNFDDDFYEA